MKIKIKIKIIIQIVFLLITISPGYLKGTVRNYTNFLYSHLNFSICHNHDYISQRKIIYYKGLSELLNEYIAEIDIPGNIHHDVISKTYMKAHKKWLNLYHDEEPILSYFYERNKFYQLF